MKFLCQCSILLTFSLPAAFAQENFQQNLSVVKSIDDQDLPPSDIEVSDEGLPYEDYLELKELLDTGNFTILPESRVRTLFSELTKNPRARNRIAGGKCAIRRSYIQGYLRKLSIKSGKLLINCPANNGRMRLIDQVTGRRYTFSNFHDVNIVAVPSGYNAMDVQFASKSMSLSGYLAVVEASQKLKPLKNRAAGEKGYCYWSIK
jgi:hypothetical protein